MKGLRIAEAVILKTDKKSEYEWVAGIPVSAKSSYPWTIQSSQQQWPQCPQNNFINRLNLKL